MENKHNQEEAMKEVLSANTERRKQLVKQGVVVLNEDVTTEKMEQMYFDILEASKNENIKKITIYINSDGGDARAMFTLMSLIDGIQKPVETIVLGHAYSAGAFIAMCGHKGYRKAYKYSEFLVHEVARFGREVAKATQYKYNNNNLQSINNIIKKETKSRTKMTDKTIKRFMESNIDEFMFADDALKYGLIDEII